MPNTTLVTGAAGALGGVVVQALRSQGHRVIAVDLPGSMDRLRQLGDGVTPAAIDTRDPSAWSGVIRDAGALTGAVMIAGGWRGGGPLHERSDDAIWNAMFSANLESAYHALRVVLPGMVERRAGSVVLIGSRVALRPETSQGAAEYAAMKSGVVALAQTVAAEVLEHGVRVNAVLPSAIDTPANRRAMPKADPSRWVSPDSLAGVISFLLSDAARDISGAALPVYGRA